MRYSTLAQREYGPSKNSSSTLYGIGVGALLYVGFTFLTPYQANEPKKEAKREVAAISQRNRNGIAGLL